MKRVVCALLLFICTALVAPSARAQDARPQWVPGDLTGTWIGHAMHAGDSTPLAIEIEPSDSTSVRLRLSIPAIHWRRIAIGPVPFRAERATIALGPFEVAYDPSAQTLRGTLPRALVPIYDIPLTLRRAQGLDLPERPRLDAMARGPEWVFEAGAPIWAGATHAAGVVYVGDDAGLLHALDARTGLRKWVFRTGGAIRSRPVVDDGTVFLQADDGLLYAISAETGTEEWRVPISDSATARLPLDDPSSRYDPTSAAVTVARGLLTVGTRDGQILALDRANGALRWSFATADAVVAEPVIVDGTVYAASFDHHVYALDAEHGTLRWQHDTGAPVASTPAVADGLVIVGSRSYDLIGLDAGSGTMVWRRYVWFSWIESSVAVRNGVGYVGSSDAQVVFAFDPRTGAAHWQSDVFGWAWGRPAASDERVYIATAGLVGYTTEQRAAVFALDRLTGNPTWVFEPGIVPPAGPFGFPGPVALSDDFVFAAGLDGRLYALRR
jgi:outer membrane protein assembly factor BamB